MPCSARPFPTLNSAGLIPPKPRGAIDATGYETHHASRYYVWRQGNAVGRSSGPSGRSSWRRPAICSCRPTSAAAPARTRRNSSPRLGRPRPAVRDTLLGDRGYDAEHNHAYGRERLKIRSTVFPLNRRNSGRRGRRPNTAGKCGSGSADGRGGPATGGSTASAGRSRAASRGRNACSARPYGPANGSARRKKSSCGC